MSNARDRGEQHKRSAGPCDPAVSAPEDIARMHFSAENYSVAADYFRKALEAPGIVAYPDRFRIHLHISDCHRWKGEYARAEESLAAAEQLLPEPAPDVDRGKVDFRAAHIDLVRGNVDEAQRLALNAYDRLRDTDDHVEVALIQTLLGHCHARAGRLAKAEDFFVDALSSFRRANHRIGVSYGYNNLGVMHKNACRWEQALASLSKSREIAEHIGHTQHLFRVQLNLGVVYLKMRRFDEAVEVLDAAVASAERFGDKQRLTKALLMKGRTLATCGQPDDAQAALLRGRALAAEQGYSRELILADEYLGELMMARGDTAGALDKLEAALREATKIAPEGDVVAECLRRTAHVHYLRNRHEDALEEVARGIRIAEKCGEVFELGYLHRTRAQCQLRLGSVESAIEALEVSIKTFGDYRNPYEAARSTQLLARVYTRMARGGGRASLLKARSALHSCIDGFNRLDERRDEMISHALLANVERRLGSLGDALASVYRADRLAEVEGDARFQWALRTLRTRVESRMSRLSTPVADELSAFGDAQAGSSSRESVIDGISSTLKLILNRVGARSGFVAIPARDGRRYEPVSREGFTPDEAKRIESWYQQGEGPDVMLLTDLQSHPGADDLRKGLSKPTGTLLLQRLGCDGDDLGLLCVHRDDELGRRPLGPNALQFVGAYSSLISLSVRDLVRSEQRARWKPRSSCSKGFENFVTENDDMIDIMNLAERVAESRATVLLLGETGTGKGVIAQAIHAMSARHEEQFVHVNCAALPEQLLESELFGHVRGSFTGAFADKDGLLHEADGGTIFLDEIGKTSLAMQGKLLQFLDTSRVRKVGSNDLRTVDVRIICASKSDLQELIRSGRFLEDLFYRINDFPLTIPPLRQRPEDIALLMNHYIDKVSQEMDRPVRGMTDEFLARMRAYKWPGNVRELAKVVRRALILADRNDMLDVIHLPPELLRVFDATPEGDDSRTLRDRLADVERDEIRTALHRHAGNKSKVATRLGISYPSLLAKIKRYNLQ